MAVRSRSMVPSTASRVLIRVEEYGNGRMAGLLFNPYLEMSMRFADVIDFTNRLDQMFDELSFPQAAMEYRSFASGKKPRGKDAENKQEREPVQKMAKNEALSGQESDTFIVHVQFRQNATWQGTIKWAGQNEEKRFRSTLELLKIMDSALAQNHPGEGESGL